MSVVFKGMDMPKSCPCKLVGVGYDLYCSFTSGIPSRMREYVECCGKETRPDWCPLAEIPTPHGRLIDTDALKAWFVEWYDLNADLEIIHFLEILSEEDSAPTIIEAEGGRQNHDALHEE